MQVTEDGGGAWRKVETFPGVPANTYVSDLEPSPHDEATVYAAFDNHKMGDFKPYLLKSTDRGTDVGLDRGRPAGAGDRLHGRRGSREKPGLLYCGTEFGLFFTPDGGKRWIPAQGRDADDRGARPRDPEARGRSRRRDVRARVLRPRRPDADPPRDGRAPREGRGRSCPSRTPGCTSRRGRSACGTRRSRASRSTRPRTRRSAPSSPTT